MKHQHVHIPPKTQLVQRRDGGAYLIYNEGRYPGVSLGLDKRLHPDHFRVAINVFGRHFEYSWKRKD